MVFLFNLGLNLRDRLCGAPGSVSAQSFDFLDFGQKIFISKLETPSGAQHLINK